MNRRGGTVALGDEALVVAEGGQPLHVLGGDLQPGALLDEEDQTHQVSRVDAAGAEIGVLADGVGELPSAGQFDQHLPYGIHALPFLGGFLAVREARQPVGTPSGPRGVRHAPPRD